MEEDAIVVAAVGDREEEGGSKDEGADANLRNRVDPLGEALVGGRYGIRRGKNEEEKEEEEKNK